MWGSREMGVQVGWGPCLEQHNFLVETACHDNARRKLIVPTSRCSRFAPADPNVGRIF
jgi:hypothetical protein